MSQDNIDLVRRLEAAYDADSLDVLDEVLSSDLEAHTPGSDQIPPGIEGIKAATRMANEAFPDRKLAIEDIFSEGDLVVVRERMTGTNRGGLPGSGSPRTTRPSTTSGSRSCAWRTGKSWRAGPTSTSRR
jgi:predicted ester cyclase